jgi:hypothetical protein
MPMPNWPASLAFDDRDVGVTNGLFDSLRRDHRNPHRQPWSWDKAELRNEGRSPPPSRACALGPRSRSSGAAVRSRRGDTKLNLAAGGFDEPKNEEKSTDSSGACYRAPTRGLGQRRPADIARKLDTVAVVAGGEVLKIISRRADPELRAPANGARIARAIHIVPSRMATFLRAGIAQASA